jgi:hypothetical protein
MFANVDWYYMPLAGLLVLLAGVYSALHVMHRELAIASEREEGR